MKNGILVVSFGTTYEETAEKNIYALEKEIHVNYPDYEVFSAFTSDMVRKILKKRGILKNSVREAISEMKEKGVECVYVLPTHLLYGYEYEKIETALEEVREEFQVLKLARPLLADTWDSLEIIKILGENHPNSVETALLLVGHGTKHFSNAIYPALDYMAKQSGYPHIYVSTLEGYPELPTVLPQLQENHYKNVHLVPLMLVAGDHAENDICGDSQESYRNILENMGFMVTFQVKGMGEYPEVRNLYKKHLEDILSCS